MGKQPATVELHGTVGAFRWCLGCDEEPVGIVTLDAEGDVHWWVKPLQCDTGGHLGEARSVAEAKAIVERTRTPKEHL